MSTKLPVEPRVGARKPKKCAEGYFEDLSSYPTLITAELVTVDSKIEVRAVSGVPQKVTSVGPIPDLKEMPDTRALYALAGLMANPPRIKPADFFDNDGLGYLIRVSRVGSTAHEFVLPIGSPETHSLSYGRHSLLPTTRGAAYSFFHTVAQMRADL